MAGTPDGQLRTQVLRLDGWPDNFFAFFDSVVVVGPYRVFISRLVWVFVSHRVSTSSLFQYIRITPCWCETFVLGSHTYSLCLCPEVYDVLGCVCS